MVKYADGPTTQVEVRIEAPAAAVWPLLIDIELPARFSPELRGADWVDAGPALGATFRGHNRYGEMEWDVTCTVTDFEPGRRFEWTVGDVENKVARWRFEVTPVDEASSSLVFSAEMGPGPSGLTPAIERMPEREEDIVARRLEEWTANMRLTADGIKEIAEADAFDDA